MSSRSVVGVALLWAAAAALALPPSSRYLSDAGCLCTSVCQGGTCQVDANTCPSASQGEDACSPPHLVVSEPTFSDSARPVPRNTQLSVTIERSRNFGRLQAVLMHNVMVDNEWVARPVGMAVRSPSRCCKPGPPVDSGLFLDTITMTVPFELNSTSPLFFVQVGVIGDFLVPKPAPSSPFAIEAPRLTLMVGAPSVVYSWDGGGFSSFTIGWLTRSLSVDAYLRFHLLDASNASVPGSESSDVQVIEEQWVWDPNSTPNLQFNTPYTMAVTVNGERVPFAPPSDHSVTFVAETEAPQLLEVTGVFFPGEALLRGSALILTYACSGRGDLFLWMGTTDVAEDAVAVSDQNALSCDSHFVRFTLPLATPPGLNFIFLVEDPNAPTPATAFTHVTVGDAALTSLRITWFPDAAGVAITADAVMIEYACAGLGALQLRGGATANLTTSTRIDTGDFGCADSAVYVQQSTLPLGMNHLMIVNEDLEEVPFVTAFFTLLVLPTHPPRINMEDLSSLLVAGAPTTIHFGCEPEGNEVVRVGWSTEPEFSPSALTLAPARFACRTSFATFGGRRPPGQWYLYVIESTRELGEGVVVRIEMSITEAEGGVLAVTGLSPGPHLLDTEVTLNYTCSQNGTAEMAVFATEHWDYELNDVVATGTCDNGTGTMAFTLPPERHQRYRVSLVQGVEGSATPNVVVTLISVEGPHEVHIASIDCGLCVTGANATLNVTCSAEVASVTFSISPDDNPEHFKVVNDAVPCWQGGVGLAAFTLPPTPGNFFVAVLENGVPREEGGAGEMQSIHVILPPRITVVSVGPSLIAGTTTNLTFVCVEVQAVGIAYSATSDGSDPTTLSTFVTCPPGDVTFEFTLPGTEGEWWLLVSDNNGFADTVSFPLHVTPFPTITITSPSQDAQHNFLMPLWLNFECTEVRAVNFSGGYTTRFPLKGNADCSTARAIWFVLPPLPPVEPPSQNDPFPLPPLPPTFTIVAIEADTPLPGRDPATATRSVTVLAPPTLTLSQPAAGSVFTAGGSMVIAWDNAAPSQGSFWLIKGGDGPDPQYIPLVTSPSTVPLAAVERAKTLTLPTSLSGGNEYYAAIRIVGSEPLAAFSGPFTIVALPPALRLLRPAPGTLFLPGDSITVEWNSQGISDANAVIRLSKGDVQVATVTFEMAAGTNSFPLEEAWGVGSDFSLSIEGEETSGVNSTVSGLRISPSPLLGPISIQIPFNGGIRVGGSVHVSWNTLGVPAGTKATISICHLFNSECVEVGETRAPPPAPADFSAHTVADVTIPWTALPQIVYAVSVALAGVNNGQSPPFTMQDADPFSMTIAVTAPNAPLVTTVDTSLDVAWSVHGHVAGRLYVLELVCQSNLAVPAAAGTEVAQLTPDTCSSAVCDFTYTVTSLPAAGNPDPGVTCALTPQGATIAFLQIRAEVDDVTVARALSPALYIQPADTAPPATATVRVVAVGAPVPGQSLFYRVGESVGFTWSADYVPAGATVEVWLRSTSPSFTPIMVSTSVVGQEAHQAVNGTFTIPALPALATAAGGGGSGGGATFSLTVTITFPNGGGVPVSTTASQPFAIVPTSGQLAILTPTADSALLFGGKLSVAIASLGAAFPLSIQLLHANNMSAIATIDASVAAATSFPYVWTIPAGLAPPAGGSLSARIRVSTLTNPPLTATSPPFPISPSPISIASVLAANTSGVAAGSFELGTPITLTWRATGLPPTATLTLGVTDTQAAPGAYVVTIASSVLATKGQLVWTPNVGLPVSTTQQRYAVEVSANSYSAACSTHIFSFALPASGLSISPVSATVTQSATVTLAWVCLGGATDAVNISLKNTADKSVVVPVAAGLPASGSLQWTVPTSLDLSPAVSGAYMLVVEGYSISGNGSSVVSAHTPPFSVLPLRVSVRILAPLAAQLVPLSDDSIAISWDATTLPLNLDPSSHTMNVTLRNENEPSVDVPVTTTALLGAAAIPMDRVRALFPSLRTQSMGAFYVAIQSNLYPGVSAPSPRFTIRDLAAPSLAVQVWDTSSDTVTAGGPEGTLLKVAWSATATPLGCKIRLYLGNTVSGEGRLVSAPDIDVTQGDSYLVLDAGATQGWNASKQTAAKGAFFIAVRPVDLTCGDLSAGGSSVLTSAKFTLFTPTTTSSALLTLSSPTRPLTRAGGEDVALAWAALGVAPDALVTITLHNADPATAFTPVLLRESLPGQGSVSVSIPACTPPSPTYYMRVATSATIFASTPLIAVGDPNLPTLTITTPSAGMKVAVESILDVAWASSGVTGDVTLTLSNPLLPDGWTMEITSGVAVGDGNLRFTVPATLPTALAVRGSYIITIACGSTRTVSPAFTILAADSGLALVIVDPMAAAADGGATSAPTFTPGASIQLWWSGSGSGSSTSRLANVTLVNEKLGGSWPLATIQLARRNATLTLPPRLPTSYSTMDAWKLQVSSNVAGTSPVTVTSGFITIAPLSAVYTIHAPALGEVVQLGGELQVVTALTAESAADLSLALVDVTLRNTLTQYVASLATAVETGAATLPIPVDTPTTSNIRNAYFIRVSSANDGSVFVDSDPITVAANPTPIKLLRPASGLDSVVRGGSVTITWSAVDLQGTVTLELTNTLAGLSLPIAQVEASLGAFAWSVPASLVLPPPGARSSFVVRAFETANPPNGDLSAPFTISASETRIRLLTPPATSAGAKVSVGAPLPVTWQAFGAPAGSLLRVVVRPSAGSSSGSDADGASTTTLDLGLLPFTPGACGESGESAEVACGTTALSTADLSALSEQSAGLWVVTVSLGSDDGVHGSSAPFAILPLPPSAAIITAPTADQTFAIGVDRVVVSWTDFTSPATRVTIACIVDAASGVEVVFASKSLSLPADVHTVAVAIPVTVLSRHSTATSFKCTARVTSYTRTDPIVVTDDSVSAVFTLTPPKPQLQNVRVAFDSAFTLAPGITATGRTLLSIAQNAPFVVGWDVSGSGALATPASSLSLVRLLAGGSSTPVFDYEEVEVGAPATGILPDNLQFAQFAFQVTVSYPLGGPDGANLTIRGLSQPFQVVPTNRTVAVTSPITDMSVAPGGIIELKVAMEGVAPSESFRVELYEYTVGGGGEPTATLIATLADEAQATGLVKVAAPTSWEADTAGRTFFLRLTLTSTLASAAPLYANTAGALTIPLPSRYLTLASNLNATGSGGAAGTATLSGGESVWVNWTAGGLTGDEQYVRIDLWQDKFVAVGGDVLLASLTPQAAVADGAFLWQVPTDLPSQLPVYLKVEVVSPAADNLWARTSNFNLRSAPVPGLSQYLSIACAEAAASGATSLPPICSLTCEACVAALPAGANLWIPAASVTLDYDIPDWAGGVEDLHAFKNALGAFSATGVNLCVPAAALASSDGVTLPLGGVVASVQAAAGDMSGGRVSVADTILSLSRTQDRTDTCAFNPVVQGETSIPVDPADLTRDDASGLGEGMQNEAGGALDDSQVDVLDLDVTVVGEGGDSAYGNRRRRLTGGNSQVLDVECTDAASTSVTVHAVTSDDASAQAAADTLGGAALAAGDCVASEVVTTAYTADSQGSVDAATGTATVGFPPKQAAMNRPLSGSGSSAFSSSAFDEGGEYSYLEENGNRESTATPVVPGPDGPIRIAAVDNKSDNVGLIVGVVVGGIVAIALALGVVLVRRKWAAASLRVRILKAKPAPESPRAAETRSIEAGLTMTNPMKEETSPATKVMARGASQMMPPKPLNARQGAGGRTQMDPMHSV